MGGVRVKRPRLDPRTRKVGAPPIEVREESKKTRHPLAPAGLHPKIKTTNDFVEIQAVPGAVTVEEITKAVKNHLRGLDSTPLYVAPRLATAVLVEGPVINGQPVVVEESNEHEWVPTYQWVPREMYYGEAVIIDGTKFAPTDPQIVARLQTATQALVQQAHDDHDDNRWIYITGIWIQTGYKR